jgi:hypothetical protein
MTPEELRQAASIMLAAADGEEIEVANYDHMEWCPTKDPTFNWYEYTYRIKPKTITIGDMEVPEPVSEPLKAGTQYFIVDINDDELYDVGMWVDINDDELHDVGMWAVDRYDEYEYLSKCLIHLTKEAAIQHAKALIKVSGGEIDD